MGILRCPSSIPCQDRVRCLSSVVSLHLFPALTSDVSHSGWCCLALSLLVFLYSICLPLWLALPSFVRLSGCLLFAFTWLSSFFSYHLSPDSSVFNHQSALAVVSDSFACSTLCASSLICFPPSVSHFMCLPIQMPLVAVSCSCFIVVSFVIGPYLCFVSSFVSSCCLRSYTSIDPR